MERVYLCLIIACILLVMSLIWGVAAFGFENDSASTRFVEGFGATIVALLFALGYYISARIKEKKEK